MTGHKAGSLKHSIAENIVKDYQNNIADRNLDMEIRYKGHTATAGNANINGYTRIDVHDKGSNQVYNYNLNL